MRRSTTATGLAVVIAIGGSFAPVPALGAPASFDCAKASTRIEKMICADDETSDLDGQVARAYRLVLSKTDDQLAMRAYKVGQRGWLTDQRNKCPDVACLREAYRKRLATLEELAARPPGSPSVPKPAPPGAAAVRKVQFAGKETTITRDGEFEKITVRNAQGGVESESTCNVGDFDAYSALYTQLKYLAIREERAAIVKLMAYPLHVNETNGKKSRTYRKPEALLKDFDKVFDADVLAAIRRLEPADLFCRDGSVTTGGGMLWADHSGGDEARVSVINR